MFFISIFKFIKIINALIKMIIREIKYFLKFFINNKHKIITIKKIKKGTLLPAIIRPMLIIIEAIQNNGNLILNPIFLKFSKTKNKNIKKKEKRYRYDPAINSSPNGPPNLLLVASKPKITLPKINW